MKGHKQSRDPKNSTAPPGFEIPRSATAKISIYNAQFVIDILDNIIVSQVELTMIKILNKQLDPSNVISSLWSQSI